MSQAAYERVDHMGCLSFFFSFFYSIRYRVKGCLFSPIYFVNVCVLNRKQKIKQNFLSEIIVAVINVIKESRDNRRRHQNLGGLWRNLWYPFPFELLGSKTCTSRCSM